MDVSKIDGIGALLGGILGFLVTAWDWTMSLAVENIVFEVVFLVVAAVGLYVLSGRGKKIDAEYRSPRYAVR